MDEVVFDTEAEALAQEAIDLAAHHAVHDDPAYVSATTRWAIPVQRLDGKWAYPTCACSDYTGLTVEAYDPNNYG